MRPQGKCLTIAIYFIGILCLNSGCAYGPAILGSELPVVPIPTLDTVKKSNTYLMGTAAWPSRYSLEDKNFLVGVGVQRTVASPFNSQYESAAWSFVYGGMAYRGTYQLQDTTLQQRFGIGAKSYQGLLLHGAVRLHIIGSKNFIIIPELAASLYYEDGDYYLFRKQYNQENGSNASPLGASLFLPFSLRYNFDKNTYITSSFTNGFTISSKTLRFMSLGSLAVTRLRLTAWVQAGIGIDIYTVALLPSSELTAGTGLSYRIGK